MVVIDSLRALVVAGVMSVVSLASPSEVIVDDIVGLSTDGRGAEDLDYAEFAAVAPDSVVHVEPGSELADELVAAVQDWTSSDGERIRVEVVRAIDGETASSFVDRAAAVAIAEGLSPTEPPFPGAWSYSGPGEDLWLDIVSWSQGPFAVTMTRTASGPGAGIVDEVARRQSGLVTDVTGAAVNDDVVVEGPEPVGVIDERRSGTMTGISVAGIAAAGIAVIGGSAVAAAAVRRRQDRRSP